MSLALSAASEQSQSNVESLLGGSLVLKILILTIMTSLYTSYAQPGVTFGHKNLTVSGEEQHIFAAVVRGTTNAADVITDLYSIYGAFQVSGQNVYNLLDSYIEDYCHLNPDEIGEAACFFVTGHSLGGATGNVLVQKLNESYGTQKVFAYTFASPTTAFPSALSNESGNIYNILNNEDLVPLLPPDLWNR